MKKSMKWMVATSLLVLMTACTANKNALDQGNRGARVTDINRNDNIVNLKGNRTNQQFDVADDIANSIARMKEVDRATVIVTDHKAYVSVKLNGTGNILNGNRDTTTTLDRNANDGNYRTNRTNYLDNNRGTVFNDDNIDNNHFTTNTLPANLERKITKRVKSHDRSIDRVYISADTSFFNNMTNYSTNIRNGNFDGNLITDFNNTVRRIFTNNR